MITINLDAPLKDLDGNPVNQMAKLVAAAIGSSNQGPAVRMFQISSELHKTGVMTVDAPEFEQIRAIIDGPTLANLAKGQILPRMDSERANWMAKERETKAA